MKVTIIEEAIRMAFHFRMGTRDVHEKHTALEKNRIFVAPQPTRNTFDQLKYEEVINPLQIFIQHFKLGTPQRHTVLDVTLAFAFSYTAEDVFTPHNKWADYFLLELVELKKSTDKKDHMAGGHALTRLVYYLMGSIDKLPGVAKPAVKASSEGSHATGISKTRKGKAAKVANVEKAQE